MVEEVATVLLLSYTYPLNTKCGKFLSMGYHPTTLQPCISLQSMENKKSAIILSVFEWQGIVLQINQLNLNGGTRKIVNIVPTLAVIMLKNKDGNIVVVFRKKIMKKKIIVVLSMQEWETFLSITQFANPLLYYLQLATQQVEIYTIEYIKRCVEKRSICLLEEDFFIFKPFSDFSNVSVNYFRLFYELPIFCTKKIMENLFK